MLVYKVPSPPYSKRYGNNLLYFEILKLTKTLFSQHQFGWFLKWQLKSNDLDACEQPFY